VQCYFHSDYSFSSFLSLPLREITGSVFSSCTTTQCDLADIKKPNNQKKMHSENPKNSQNYSLSVHAI